MCPLDVGVRVPFGAPIFTCGPVPGLAQGLVLGTSLRKHNESSNLSGATKVLPMWRSGLRSGLKSRGLVHEGSSPSIGTKFGDVAELVRHGPAKAATL